MRIKRKKRKRLNRYQIGMRMIVILLLVFFISLSFGLEMVFTVR